MDPRPCGVHGDTLSALVDGALGHRERERLAVHALSCPACRAELVALRRTAALLRAGTSCVAPQDRLAARLLAIPDQHRPPLSRRARRVRAVLAATVVATVSFSGAATAVGWAAAPPPREQVKDPGVQGTDEFVAVEAGRPLGSQVAAAVMAADAGALAGAPVAITPRSIAPAPDLDAVQLTRTLAAVSSSNGRVTLDGEQRIRVVQDGRHLSADAQVHTRAGQGTHVIIRSDSGEVLSDTFSAPVPSSRITAAPALPLGPDQHLTGRAGQRVAGRSAVVLEVSGPQGVEARWWVDELTGVQLWRERWTAGVPRESVGFTAVRLGGQDDFWPHLQPQLTVPVTTASLTLSSVGGLTAQGWECRGTLAGLPLAQVRSDTRSDVLHTVYGTTAQTVSVMQQRGSLPEQLDGFTQDEQGIWRHQGWPAQTVWQSGGTVFTVTGDSAEQVAAVTNALPHHAPDGRAPWDRVRAGWARVGDIVLG